MVEIHFNMSALSEFCSSVKEEFLFVAFEQWLDRISGLVVDNECFIRWCPRERQWFNYNPETGSYEPFFEEQINQIYGKFCENYRPDADLTPSDYTLMLKRLKARCLFDGQWNKLGFENMQNGVINLWTGELLEHHWQYMFRYTVPRNYHAEPIHHCTLWIFNSILNVCDQPALLKRFLVAMVHRDFTNEMFVMLYGERGTGKSTLLTIPRMIFGDNLMSATNLYKLGQRFGLSQCYDKRVNINPDMPIKKLYPDAIATLKTLTGGESGSDGRIEIERKGIDSFSVLLQCYFMFGCNQLPEFSSESLSECESIGRRALLLKCSKHQIRCPDLKFLMSDPEFLDDIYSYLLQEKVAPIIQGDLQTYIDSVLEKWFTDCDPLLSMIKEHYAYSSNVLDKVGQKEILDTIIEELSLQNMPVPKNLAAQITQSLTVMKIRKDNNHKQYKYCNIMKLGETEEPKSGELNLRGY